VKTSAITAFFDSTTTSTANKISTAVHTYVCFGGSYRVFYNLIQDRIDPWTKVLDRTSSATRTAGSKQRRVIFIVQLAPHEEYEIKSGYEAAILKPEEVILAQLGGASQPEKLKNQYLLPLYEKAIKREKEKLADNYFRVKASRSSQRKASSK
jgi:hypothetical protein